MFINQLLPLEINQSVLGWEFRLYYRKTPQIYGWTKVCVCFAHLLLGYKHSRMVPTLLVVLLNTSPFLWNHWKSHTTFFIGLNVFRRRVQTSNTFVCLIKYFLQNYVLLWTSAPAPCTIHHASLSKLIFSSFSTSFWTISNSNSIWWFNSNKKIEKHRFSNWMWIHVPQI